ncbi:MAG TPA: chloride channel protein [Anaerohalosphaeraceae bacterium]|nr:chloride channel protein [Phycisphaerae bacterium]HOK95316.1 chloride channel protein [Anaerohalosphaeraceae bacterium]HOM76157.1 chloride channel protein [Anaerohalosphaeraceae bacterium]HPC65045.1 chloride channel protein [Anaerohalosphaeraceae bacterium]HPO69913.1 chloride channel protein [Anaerohalosphaeraceae bacterium]
MEIDRKVGEQVVLFISVVKWAVLGMFVGGIVGCSTAVFIKTLNWSISFTSQYPYYFLLMPAGFLASSLIVKLLAPQAEGHGTEKIIEAIHKQSGKISPAVVPVKLVATIITIALGGSAGKEGPAAQIGAALASCFADLLRFDDNDRKKLVICGISAGFSSVFGTPVGGAIFGVEVLFAGSMMYEVLLPSFIAGVTAYQVSSVLGLNYFQRPIEFIPVFSGSFFIKVIAAGFFFGLVSLLFIEIMTVTHKAAKKIPLQLWIRPLLGGLICAILALVFSRDYLGLGVETIESCLKGMPVVWYAFLMKVIFTSVTLAFGGSGGIVTPIFFIGAAAGNTYGHFFGLDPAVFSSIGFVSLLAGCANTPISASIISIELFGPQLAPYAAAACIVSFLMTGHRSIYSSQVLAIRKSASIDVQIGRELIAVTACAHPREKSLSAFLLRLIKKLKIVLKGDFPQKQD